MRPDDGWTLHIDEDTYGKVYILWDPGKNVLPIGTPGITVPDLNSSR